jgi:hypothetical protein
MQVATEGLQVTSKGILEVVEGIQVTSKGIQ